MTLKIEFTENGYKAPSTQEINTSVWSLIDDAMGGNTSRVQGTFQYQLATSVTAIIKDFHDDLIQLANQFNPTYAQGIYQDAVGELYFMTRKLATNSICPVVFKGLVGAIIPSGFAVQDLQGRTWRTTGTYNIGVNGLVTITCTCEVSGAIEALPNSIVVIPTGLNGLDEVYNTESAIMGYDEEGRVNFEIRRKESVAINGKMTDEATRGAVLNVRNVVDAYVISNPTDATVVKGETDYPLIRNSIVVSVVGGDDYDVARAAFIKAGTGCSWNGNTDVTVIDNTYDFNPPKYPIKILRPAFKKFYIKVTIQDVSKLSFTNEEAIKNLIIEKTSTGSTRLRIGKNFLPMDYVCGMPSIGIKSILASFDKTDWLTELPVGIDEFLTLDKIDISIEGS